MISHNIFTGTVVLLAAGLANAGPCRPSSIASSSTVVASVIETAASSFESETTTSTVSIDATQTATTATQSESESESETGTTVIVETTPTASSAETTTTAPAITTAETTTAETTTEATTTTAAATTTTEGPEAVETMYIYAQGSSDPVLASLGGTGFADLSDSPIPDVEYVEFTNDVASELFFTLGERSGKVKIGNGPHVGKLVGYFSTSDYSLLIALDAATAEENDISPIDCEIVQGNGGEMLQCQYGDSGNADFWTCGGKFTLVKPGVDFTNKCPQSAAAYKLNYIQVVRL
ncbi:hypothetical protein FACUT_778 [Fusarium acutatum]|uniref:Uncharacterized protein n=1 Tax=Fusarium acutatum TaxID=78861 RepID=A0A8H4P0H9_9HYPO|nr:hypothetical protein FACUT_778 [Fusarium acutatum]